MGRKKETGSINIPLALEEKHSADAPYRQSNREGEARRYTLDSPGSLVCDTDDVGAESLDSAKTLVDYVGCKVDNAGRGMFYVSSDGPKPVGEFTHCLL